MSEKNLNLAERCNEIIIRQENVFEKEGIFGETNKAWISGIIEEEFEYSHNVFGEEFYKTIIRVTRMSGVDDYVPVVVSSLLLRDIIENSVKGKFIEAGGEFRSHNRMGEDNKSHLDLFLFAKSVNICESEEELKEEKNTNLIYFDAYICKPPLFRVTSFSKRLITDLILAVNRPHYKSNYIPCIAWGTTALYVANELKVGDQVKVYGRVQSRKFIKDREFRTAYEISILKMVKVEKEKADM